MVSLEFALSAEHILVDVVLISGFCSVLAQIEFCPGCTGVLDSPLLGLGGKLLGLVDHHGGNLCVLRVFGVRRLEEHSEGDEGCLDSLYGRPA